MRIIAFLIILTGSVLQAICCCTTTPTASVSSTGCCAISEEGHSNQEILRHSCDCDMVRKQVPQGVNLEAHQPPQIPIIWNNSSFLPTGDLVEEIGERPASCGIRPRGPTRSLLCCFLI